MRVLAFSDLHHARARAMAIVEASSEADLVIGAGDFCNMRQDLDGALDLLAGIPAPLVMVPGNAESHAELAAAAPAGGVWARCRGLPVVVGCISGARCPSWFLVEVGAAIRVASTTVPCLSSKPLAISVALTVARIWTLRLFASSR